jgi:hypothetical protein
MQNACIPADEAVAIATVVGNGGRSQYLEAGDQPLSLCMGMPSTRRSTRNGTAPPTSIFKADCKIYRSFE